MDQDALYVEMSLMHEQCIMNSRRRVIMKVAEMREAHMAESEPPVCQHCVTYCVKVMPFNLAPNSDSPGRRSWLSLSMATPCQTRIVGPCQFE
jgi:hypothetical protein